MRDNYIYETCLKLFSSRTLVVGFLYFQVFSENPEEDHDIKVLREVFFT